MKASIHHHDSQCLEWWISPGAAKVQQLFWEGKMRSGDEMNAELLWERLIGNVSPAWCVSSGWLHKA